MVKEKILIVEDEEDILELIDYNLSREGYRTTGTMTGEEAMALIKKQQFDLVILDLMLPDLNGLEVCRIIKGDPETRNLPIMMVTAKGEEADIVTGLELGADDYLPKPFSPRVLVARIHALLRRISTPPAEEETPLDFDDLEILPGRHEVRVKGKGVKLTLTEFRILHFLARKPGWVFSRYQIIDAVQGEDYIVTDRSVDVQIVGLRKKLGPAGKHIETVRGVGYRFKE
jgi:two-component system phosphate regulon response regulator PhoB